MPERFPNSSFNASMRRARCAWVSPVRALGTMSCVRMRAFASGMLAPLSARVPELSASLTASAPCRAAIADNHCGHVSWSSGTYR